MDQMVDVSAHIMLLYIHYRIGHLCYHRSNDFLQLGTIMTIVSITYILVACPYKKQYGLYNNLDAILLLSILGVFFWWSHTMMTGLCYFMIYLSLYWLFYSFSFHLLTSLHLCATNLFQFSNPNCATVAINYINQQIQV